MSAAHITELCSSESRKISLLQLAKGAWNKRLNKRHTYMNVKSQYRIFPANSFQASYLCLEFVMGSLSSSRLRSALLSLSILGRMNLSLLFWMARRLLFSSLLNWMFHTWLSGILLLVIRMSISSFIRLTKGPGNARVTRVVVAMFSILAVHGRARRFWRRVESRPIVLG